MGDLDNLAITHHIIPLSFQPACLSIVTIGGGGVGV